MRTVLGLAAALGAVEGEKNDGLRAMVFILVLFFAYGWIKLNEYFGA
jgi:hypothetical protein